jgi:hypothetical protein
MSMSIKTLINPHSTNNSMLRLERIPRTCSGVLSTLRRTSNTSEGISGTSEEQPCQFMRQRRLFGWNMNGPLIELEDIVEIGKKLKVKGWFPGTIILPRNTNKRKSLLSDEYACLFEVRIAGEMPPDYSTTLGPIRGLNPDYSVVDHSVTSALKPICLVTPKQIQNDNSEWLGVLFTLETLCKYAEITAGNEMARPYALTFKAECYDAPLPCGEKADLTFADFTVCPWEPEARRLKYNCPASLISLLPGQ